jgi:hypothetical protein
MTFFASLLSKINLVEDRQLERLFMNIQLIRHATLRVSLMGSTLLVDPTSILQARIRR